MYMKSYILLLSLCWAVFAHYTGILSKTRYKRDAVGALDIHTNNAQSIHADLKSDNAEVSTIVTPPQQVGVYETKSLRKSWPLTSRIDLVRSVNRAATLAILVLSAAIEFYPLIMHLYNMYF